MSPRHALAVLLLLPLLWVVIRAHHARRHRQSPNRELADDAERVVRWMLQGPHDPSEPPPNFLHVEGVYDRVLSSAAVFMLAGFVLGAAVCKCLSL